MTPSQAYVELALRTLNCNQKELARSIGVSPCQITRWKSGEYISAKREAAFRAMLKLGTRSVAFVLWAGSIEFADKWDRLIRSLAAFIGKRGNFPSGERAIRRISIASHANARHPPEECTGSLSGMDELPE